MSSISESLTLQQLKDMKQLARLMGATDSISMDVDGASSGLSVHADTADTAATASACSGPSTGVHSGVITQVTGANPQTKNDMRPIEIDGYTKFSGAHGISYYGLARNPLTNSSWGKVNYNDWNKYGGFSINAKYSIMTNSYIISSTTYVESDRRIKTDIRDVPDHLALEQVLNIPCRYYKYKDVESRGPQDTIGFIAQEVKEVFPEAVTLMPKIIPDHMIMAEVSWEEVDGKHLMSVSNLQEDVSVGTLVKFYCNTGTPPEYNEDGSEKTPASNDFKQTPHEVEMNEDGKFEMDKEYSSVFIYGRQVNDFHVVEKSKIFALHHSAIQELHRVVEAQKATIATQQAAIDALMARVAALEGQ